MSRYTADALSAIIWLGCSIGYSLWNTPCRCYSSLYLSILSCPTNVLFDCKTTTRRSGAFGVIIFQKCVCTITGRTEQISPRPLPQTSTHTTVTSEHCLLIQFIVFIAFAFDPVNRSSWTVVSVSTSYAANNSHIFKAQYSPHRYQI